MTTTTRTCRFWSCPLTVRGDHFVCTPEHYPMFKERRLKVCRGCGWFIEVAYERCLNCTNGEPPRKGYYDSSFAGTAGINKPPMTAGEDSAVVPNPESGTATHFVYLLKLDQGEFYAGMSKDIRARLSEHLDGKTKSTSGRNPRLVWFATVDSEAEAERAEVELKARIKKNPRSIRQLVARFADVVELVNIDAAKGREP